MPCYHPLKGYQSRTLTKKGKRSVVFNPREGFIDRPVEVPCGQCRGCRLERSRQWAIRCVHEAMMYDNNCFITLTYNEENSPPDGSLRLEDWQLFIKKLRKKFGNGIRYFHSGEYGKNLGNPHYHAILFNFDFPDRTFLKFGKRHRLYNSAIAKSLWDNKGFVIIGDVTFQSAAYVARYVMKKVTGDRADPHYGKLKPEYVTMSRRPGIGSAYYKKYGKEVFRDDFIVINGKKMKVPRFYDNQLEADDPDRLAEIKLSRKVKAERYAENNTESRLVVREEVQRRKEERLIRSIEK